jgi:hypothetical protein
VLVPSAQLSVLLRVSTDNCPNRQLAEAALAATHCDLSHALIGIQVHTKRYSDDGNIVIVVERSAAKIQLMTLVEWKGCERTHKFQGDTSCSFLASDQYQHGPEAWLRHAKQATADSAELLFMESVVAGCCVTANTPATAAVLAALAQVRATTTRCPPIDLRPRAT